MDKAEKWRPVLARLLDVKAQRIRDEWGICFTREELVGWLMVDIGTMENSGGTFHIQHMASHWNISFCTTKERTGLPLDLSEFTAEDLDSGISVEELIGIIRKLSH